MYLSVYLSIYPKTYRSIAHLDYTMRISPFPLYVFKRITVEGVLFKFANDEMNLYGGIDNASKASKHDLRGCAAVLGENQQYKGIDRIHVPLVFSPRIFPWYMYVSISIYVSILDIYIDVYL